MKFLTISKTKEVFYTISQTERNKILLAAVESLLAYKKKMGDKWRCYSDAGSNQIITIGEYDSLEEYSQSLQAVPETAGYMYHESIPLIEMDTKAFQAYLQQMQAAK